MADGAALAPEGRETTPPSRIATLLASVRDAGGERVDAAGWHYLDSLAKRATAQSGTVRNMLEAKIEQAVAAFSERLIQARSAAKVLMDEASARHPHAAGELQQLFLDNDFNGIRRQCATLEARGQCAVLAELVTHLAPPLSATQGNTPGKTAARLVEPAPPILELKTVRESRASWARLSVDKQLAKAMDQAPQNAGPINSHMLILRSLAMMREISPDYLSRMVPYVDALLSLDPGETEVPVKKKKASPAKTGKPSKAVRK